MWGTHQVKERKKRPVSRENQPRRGKPQSGRGGIELEGEGKVTRGKINLGADWDWSELKKKASGQY